MTVYWRMRYRTGPDTWAYEVIEGRLLTADPNYCLVELTARGNFPRTDYIARRLHLMPTGRLHTSHAEAEAATWHDDPTVCPECGTHKIGTADCYETAVSAK